MSAENKTHYRKVFKSDHLGVADLEDLLEENNSLVFTIKVVKQLTEVVVAGKKINANIAEFVEPIKPWVINAGNGKRMAKFNDSPFVEDWGNTMVKLFIDRNVKMKGEVVGGIKIHPEQPQAGKKELTPDAKTPWSNAVSALKGDKTIDDIKKYYDLTPENQEKLISESEMPE